MSTMADAGVREGEARRVSRAILAFVMLTMGTLHFTAEPLFEQIIPPFLPAPRALVLVSGVFEGLLGLGLLLPRTRKAASYGLVALFLAVFPANIYMAVANVQIRGLPSWLPQPSEAALWIRLPFQLAFIYWAIVVGRDGADSRLQTPGEAGGSRVS